MSKVIELQDGTLVEIETDTSNYLEISGDNVVDSTLEKMNDLIIRVVSPAIKICEEIKDKNSIEKIKIGIGIKIGAEGGFILAKSNIGAHINVELEIKPKT